MDLLIPVEKDVTIGGRFHPIERSAPNILFFHGNGEIAADYNDIGPMYNNIGVNFLAVDYRGYGRSTGIPTLTSMMRDAHLVFEWVKDWLKNKNHGGPLIVMGRSLGSASALELSGHYGDRIDGLIIESGFSHIGPLLGLMGIDMKTLGIREEDGPGNSDKIRNFDKPTLIIHAEHDHIIPFAEGLELYEASPAENKRLVKISNADHNTIFFSGKFEYMEAIEEFVKEVSK
ncbi:alpha/beta hydrolase [Thermodesulfobacteriota bacterium]